MRERIARATAIAAVLLLSTLVLAFARVQNPSRILASFVAEGPPQSGLAAAATAPAADSTRGRAVFVAQACTRCHSVAGTGSPRIPLDGVGARRSAAELRAWTTGAEALADSLPPSTLKLKQGFAKLPATDLDALIAFLASLKTPAR